MANKFRSSRFAAAIGGFLVCAIVMSSLAAIWIARERSVNEWRAQLNNLSLILAEQTSHELTSAYMILDSITEYVQAAGIRSAADLRRKMATPEVHASMRSEIRAVPQIDVATIVADNGDVINITRTFPAPAINLADREYFREQAANRGLGITISKPVRNKGNNQWTFYLSRRLEGRNGEFIGLVLVGLSSAAFSSFYEKINLGEGATVTLYRRDFTILARWPHVDSLMAQVNRSGSSYKVIEEQHKASGVVISSSPRFSESGRAVYRMSAPRLIDKYPLVISITVTDELFLAQWRHLATLIAAIAIASVCAVMVAFSLLVNSLRRSEATMVLTERLKQEAEAANRAKSEFLTMMSHEIRTPLTAVNGFAELISSESSDAETRERGRLILKNGQHLLAIINDILDISKIEANRLELEKVAFSPLDVVYGIESIMRAQASAHGIAFHLDIQAPIPSRVIGDPTCWRQVLFNLCSNAVKFTEAGSVVLALRYDAERSMLACTVRDTGIGMSREQLKNLFKPFSQADRSITRQYGGTGLGLYLVDQLVRLMGGEVSAASEPGKGSTFSATIRAERAADAAWIAGEPMQHPTDGTAADALSAKPLRGRVLLAEDGADNRKLVSALFGRLGIDHVAVENGAQAVELAAQERFDVILMDIQMPVMDGVTATRRLRALGYEGPIVALTANVMAEDVKRYRESGFTGCVSKPIDFAELARCLETIVPPDAPPLATQALDDLPEYRELRQAFERSLPDSLASIEAQVELRQWSSVQEAAHSLKGTAGSFDYPRVTEHAAALELAAQQGAYADARTAVDALWALDEVRRLLEPEVRPDEAARS
jgi:signal transduction histidine kinase/DNA-binding NarL/FixJ family response regulator